MIGIIGGGMSGLFCARALARQGREVVIIEPDPPSPDDANDAFQHWQRPGVPQLRLPHSARSLIHELLIHRDKELLANILRAGVSEWNFHLYGVGEEPIAHDPQLIGLLGRRPTLEMALRKTVQQMPGVRFFTGMVKDLVYADTPDRRVTGVVTEEGETLSFDAVVVASGRRSRVLRWVEEAGLPRPHEEALESGIIYYSRYFRFLPGVDIPRGLFPSGPSGTFPCVTFTMNRTDLGTFSLMVCIAPWQAEFKALRHEAAFMHFARCLPGAAEWLDPAKSSPIWKVEPFGGLVNRYRRFFENGQPVIPGLYVVGDARFHTNPIYGWGMAFALKQSYILEDAFAAEPNEWGRQIRFEREIDAFARKYYDASVGEDAARIELWKGERPDSDRGEPGTYRHFLTTILPVAYKEQVIFRNVMRRLHLLDDPAAILHNEDVIRRAENLSGARQKSLTREDVLGFARAAAEFAHVDSPAVVEPAT